MSIKTEKITDKDMGKVTLKIMMDTRKELKRIKNQNNYETYDEAISNLINAFDNFISRFIIQYQKAINKCPQCEKRNTAACKEKCDVRYIYEELEKCQKNANILFDSGIRFIDQFQESIEYCRKCKDLNTAKCLNCIIRRDIKKIQQLVNSAKSIFK